MAEFKVSLKLLIDKKTQRVIFAEAGKDFVDFLFTLLCLPLGSVVRLLNGDDSTITATSLANIYGSVQTLNEAYLQPNAKKESLLKPTVAATSSLTGSVALMLPGDVFFQPERKFYYCGSSYHRYIAEDPRAKCPSCGDALDREIKCVEPTLPAGKAGEGGYVKGMVTYMVMDDLSVTHASMISTIAVLNAANLKAFESLEAKDVDFGVDEGLKLLEACLLTKAALTYVFLGKELNDNDEEEEDEEEAGRSNGECTVESWQNELVKKLKEEIVPSK